MKGASLAALGKSLSDERYTPPEWMARIVAEYGPFDLDPCCTQASAKAPNFFTGADDGLSKEWFGRVFMNPPYGLATPLWMRKAFQYAVGGGYVVGLVFARTDVEWWIRYAHRAPINRMTKGRIRFLGADGIPLTNTPFFGSAVVVWPGRVLALGESPIVTPIFRTKAAEEAFFSDDGEEKMLRRTRHRKAEAVVDQRVVGKPLPFIAGGNKE